VKKLLVLCSALFLFIGMSFVSFGQKTQTFDLSATVQPYVEVNPAYANVSQSMTISLPGDGNVPVFSVVTGNFDVAYANCPFSVSFVGDNPADDNIPILAMEEPGASMRYDRLQTKIQIEFVINRTNGQIDKERNLMDFLSNPEGANTGAWTNQTVTFVNVPHDGEIYMNRRFGASLPHESPDFGTYLNTWNQSADAGLYECQLIATYAAGL